MDELTKQRDRNKDQNRLKEVELELQKSNDDFQKAVKALKDNENKKKSKT